MRESLKCRDFRWFIENKVPSLASATIIGSGEVRNFHHQFCLDQQDGDNNVGLPVLVFDCTGLKGNQYWYYRSGESRQTLWSKNGGTMEPLEFLSNLPRRVAWRVMSA